MLLLLHVLMLSLLSGGSAKVVPDFEKECGQFFANGKSPTRLSGTQYKQICQTLNNVAYYATLYDTENKIPVYSAYVFMGLKGCTRQNKWYIEPHIDDNNKGPDMAREGTVNIQIRGKCQALDKDYKKSGYDRGHLAPVYLANSQSCADATFTLTNAAPQAKRFNSVLWWGEENWLAKYLEKECEHFQPVHIVTGVVPDTNVKKKVNVPSHFWTAYCCLDNNNECHISGGFIGTNVNDSSITKLSVAALETQLGTLYRTTFQLFH